MGDGIERHVDGDERHVDGDDGDMTLLNIYAATSGHQTMLCWHKHTKIVRVILVMSIAQYSTVVTLQLQIP